MRTFIMKEGPMDRTPTPCRVLVVDENPIVRGTITTLFARSGYPVVSAGRGGEAAELIQKDDFDLVVSDFDVSDMNGYQLACMIKQRNGRTKVVLMTGGGLPQAAPFVGCREIDGWLFKPFDLQSLSSRIADLNLPNAFAARLDRRRSVAA
jgi:CheY-like chemotaxis protein